MASLSIGVSGLQAAQAGIRTTEHNISNVNTAGFRRQEISYGTLGAQYSGGLLYGTGVNVETVRQLYSQFLDSEVMLDETRLARQEVYAEQATRVDQLMSDSKTGMSSAINAFFDAADEVSNDPNSNAARQVLLGSARNLAGRANSLADSLIQMRDQTNSELATLVGQVNSYAGRIAGLNQSIARLELGGTSQANDLRDQRDQLVSQLNKIVNVSSVQEEDGDFNVFIGGTQPLVMDTRAYTMTVTRNPNDANLDVPAMKVGGGTVSLSADMLTGGRMAGLLAEREEVLMPALSGLNRIAVAIAAEVNRVQRDGLDYSMTAGTDLFDSVVQRSGATTSYIDLDFTANELPNFNYSVSFDGADYTVTRIPAGGASIPDVAAGAEVTDADGNGLGFSIAAGTPTPAAGDAWQLNFADYARDMRALLARPDQVAAASSTADGPGDNRNAQALAALRVNAHLDNGATTFGNAYIQVAGGVAALASDADVGRAAFESLVKQATAAQQSVSGVNLDEEAVNLIRFQQAYQAAARAISIANGLFDEVLGIAR